MNQAAACICISLGLLLSAWLPKAWADDSQPTTVPKPLDFANPSLDNGSLFYPLGWSNDHYFAYGIVQPSEPAPDITYSIFIQNLHNQGRYWRTVITLDLEELKGNLNEIWCVVGPSVAKALQKHRIMYTPVHLQSFPIKLGDDELQIAVEKHYQYEPGSQRDLVKAYKVFLISKQKGSKMIYEALPDQTPCEFRLDVTPIGYLQSPFGQDIAILLRESPLGQHYDPGSPNYVAVGVSLEAFLSEKAAATPAK